MSTVSLQYLYLIKRTGDENKGNDHFRYMGSSEESIDFRNVLATKGQARFPGDMIINDSTMAAIAYLLDRK